MSESDVPNKPRKQKKNKYANFSKTDSSQVLESIEEAMKKSRVQQEKDRIDHSLSVRGTTVPTLKASPKLLKRRTNTNTTTTTKKILTKRSYKDVVPSDPSSFGYIQIGNIGLAHGIKGEMRIVLKDTDFAANRLLGATVDTNSTIKRNEGGQMKKGNPLLYIKKPNRQSPRPVSVISARPTQGKDGGNTWLISFDGITSRIGASAFRGYTVYVKEEDRPVMRKDEYLIRDLVNLPVYLYTEAISSTSTSTLSKSTQTNDIVSIDNTFAPGRHVGTCMGVVPPEELCDSTDPVIIAKMHAMLELKLSNEQLTLIPFVPQIVRHVVLPGGLTNMNEEQKEKEGAIFIDPPSGLLELTYKPRPKRVIIRGYLPKKASGLSNTERKQLKMITKITIHS